MYLIVGLGNPGKEYEHTRHNVGFDTIDVLAKKYNMPLNKKGHVSMYSKGKINGNDVILVKPMTYMNSSGEAVARFANYYKLDDAKQIIIILDDTDLEVGKIRIRPKGSSGGHNGLKSVIKHLGCEDFIRIRIGVGKRPSNYNQIDWVLGHFSKDDNKIINESFEKAADGAICVIESGIDKAMNKYNSKNETKTPIKKPQNDKGKNDKAGVNNNSNKAVDNTLTRNNESNKISTETTNDPSADEIINKSTDNKSESFLYRLFKSLTNKKD